MKWLHMINRLWKNIGKKGRYGVAVVIGLEGAHLLYVRSYHHPDQLSALFPSQAEHRRTLPPHRITKTKISK